MVSRLLGDCCVLGSQEDLHHLAEPGWAYPQCLFIGKFSADKFTLPPELIGLVCPNQESQGISAPSAVGWRAEALRLAHGLFYLDLIIKMLVFLAKVIYFGVTAVLPGEGERKTNSHTSFTLRISCSCFPLLLVPFILYTRLWLLSHHSWVSNSFLSNYYFPVQAVAGSLIVVPCVRSIPSCSNLSLVLLISVWNLTFCLPRYNFHPSLLGNSIFIELCPHYSY